MTTEPKPLVPCDLCGEMEPADTCAQLDPKSLALPPMPEWTADIYSGTHAANLEAWGRQLALIAQAQARRADEAEAKVKPPDLGSMTYEELWHESNASYYAMMAERDALKARVAEMEAMPEGWRTHSLKLSAVEAECDNLRATLAQRDREVLALREGLERRGLHTDLCNAKRFANGYRGQATSDVCTCGLAEALASTAQAGAEAERRVRQEEREKAAKAVDAVEELPGRMPDEMWAAIQNDRDAFEEALRITVRQSKEEAKSAILGTESGEGR